MTEFSASQTSYQQNSAASNTKPGAFTQDNLHQSPVEAERAALEAAISACQRNVRQTPDNADAYIALANAYRQANQLPLAAETYAQALLLEPGRYQVYGCLANVLAAMNRYEEALQYYSAALQMTPSPYENIENLFNLGELYKRIRLFPKALECYDYVLKMQPDHQPALIAQCQIYKQQGRISEATKLYDRLIALKPQDPSLRISKALSLPIIYQSADEIEHWRAGVEAQLDALLEMDLQPNTSLALHGSMFYLGYQGRNDKELAEKTGRIFSRLLPTAPPLPDSSAAQKKPTVGIISRYLAQTHTVGKFMQGIIQQLCREKFDVIVFSVGADNAYQQAGDEHPDDRYVVLPSDNIEKAARLIVEQAPDILLYADIGMNITTYCLAAMRLAKVQCVTWGHPVTTGLPTVDYFISSRLIEPSGHDDADSHYSEQLVRLNGLPTYYHRPDYGQIKPNREAFGLSEQDHVYLCPQSLFKFHPDFDPLIKGILERDPAGVLVLLSHYADEVNELLRQRFETTMPEVANRIRFIPRLEQERFFELLACADVMLDPLHFGGGNTTYEAFSLGIPIVTLPSAFMRSRVTAGSYRKMDLADCIVDSPEAYIDLAVRLGTNPEERARVSTRILDRCGALYEDSSVIAELEAFFMQSLSSHNPEVVAMPKTMAPVVSEPIAFRKEKKLPLKDLMQEATCPACGYHVAVSFYYGGHAPLTTLAWPKSKEQAQAMEKLPLSFVRCVECGHVHNKDFSYEKVPYSDKPNLMYNKGALWQDHLAITHELILKRLPANPTVIEIGAGDGHFLKAIARQNPQGRYVAFDPNGNLDTSDGLVEFYAELFDPACHMGEFKPDLIIIRHMLEHLENPVGFIQSLSFAAEWEGLKTDLFLEVPCIDRVFETGRTVDFFYEHNSHFTSESLRRLLTRSNARVDVLDRGYEDEVVYGYARLGLHDAGKKITNESTAFYSKAKDVDAKVSGQLDALADSGRKIAFWGGTGKAATFINRYGVDVERFPLVVDSDAAKAGTYVPGTGQLIQYSQVLEQQPMDVIIITTQWRAQDIALEIRERGIVCEQLLLEYQGRLVDFYQDEHPYRQQSGTVNRAQASG